MYLVAAVGCGRIQLIRLDADASKTVLGHDEAAS